MSISAISDYFNSASGVVTMEFRARAGTVSKNDYKTIEHMIRHGNKQVALLKMPGFSAFNFVSSTATTNNSK